MNSEIWNNSENRSRENFEINYERYSSSNRRCNGLCYHYEAQGKVHNYRYKVGQKRCSTCQVYMVIDDAKCPCCKTTLRTKPRSKRVWNQLETLPELKVISGENS